MEESLNIESLNKHDPDKRILNSRLSAGDFLEITGRGFLLSPEQLKTYSPLSFAYIGDVVYELVIRTVIVTRGNTKASHYHHKTIRYVNAAGQAQMMKILKPMLTQEEMRIFRRGCNAKPATTAKNQSRHDYRIATGFETLIGYLYLSGQTERILALINSGLEYCEGLI